MDVYSQAEGVSYDEIFEKFYRLVKDIPSQWYIREKHKFANWSQLRHALIEQYRPRLTKHMRAARLIQHRQKPNESAMHFIASMHREFDELEINDEQEKISMVQNGLHDRLRNMVICDKLKEQMHSENNPIRAPNRVHTFLHGKSTQSKPKRTTNSRKRKRSKVITRKSPKMDMKFK